MKARYLLFLFGGVAALTGCTSSAPLQAGPVPPGTTGGGGTTNGFGNDHPVILSGTFDFSYAGGSGVLKPPSPSLRTLVATSAGGFYTTNGLGLSRITGDGQLDTSFGVGGSTAPLLSDNYDTAYAIAIQRDGKLLIGGSAGAATCDTIVVARFLTNGSVDTSFGSSGVTKTPIVGTPACARSLAIDPQGRIIAMGSLYDNGGNVLVRYLSDGTLDTTFGTNGVAQHPDTTHLLWVNTGLLEPDGSFLMIGSTGVEPPTLAAAFSHFTATGATDSSFGNNGLVLSTPGGVNTQVVASIEVGSQIYLATWSYGSPAFLVRYGLNGVIDTSFGSQGTATMTFDPTYGGSPSALAVDGAGNVYVGGVSLRGAPLVPPKVGPIPSDGVLYRFTPSGALDTTFGLSGKMNFSLGTSTAITSLGFASDGTLAVGGMADQSTFLVHVQ